MKTSIKYILPGIAALGVASVVAYRCFAGPTIIVSPPTIVVNPAPAPPPTIVVAPEPVPDEYVWDGYEYVGVVGAQYYYLGPGNVWIACDPVRLHRFQTWQVAHADWHTHAIHNDHYRTVYHDHPKAAPVHDEHAPVHQDDHVVHPDSHSDNHPDSHTDHDHDHNGPPQ